MGQRYILTIACPRCGYVDDEVSYAPSSGFTYFICPACGCTKEITLRFTVEQYLEQHPQLRPVIEQAKAELRKRAKGEVGFDLEMDPDGELLLVAEIDGEENGGFELLNRFDDEWWVYVDMDIRRLMGVAVAFLDDADA